MRQRRPGYGGAVGARVTPTGVEGIHARPATLAARARAAVVDMSMMSLPVLILGMGVFMRLSGVPSPKLMTLFILGTIAAVVIGVAQVALVGITGRSYGKLAMHLRVVRVDGSKPSFGAAGVRRTLLPGLLWLVFPPFALVDVVVGVLRHDHRCLHDLLAGTHVVKE